MKRQRDKCSKIIKKISTKEKNQSTKFQNLLYNYSNQEFVVTT